MTAIAAQSEFSNAAKRSPSVSNIETYWGYIIRCQTCDRSIAILMQWVAAVLGISLLVAAFGLWTMPGSAMSQDVIGFKFGISTVMGVLGMALVWFASHGTYYEVQVDLARLELREALRNNRGVARVQNRIMFEDVDAVYIDRSAGEGAKARLLVRLSASSKVVEIASDYEENLTHLHARLGRDILGMTAEKTAKSNRGFKIKGAVGVVPPVLAV
ncbi:hypothetical protein [Profundibacter sp.]